MWFSVLPICYYLPTCSEFFVLGWSGGARPISVRETVDPEVWTWQLILESRWRFAGLMEDSPTLLGRKGFLQLGEAPLVIGDSHEL